MKHAPKKAGLERVSYCNSAGETQISPSGHSMYSKHWNPIQPVPHLHTGHSLQNCGVPKLLHAPLAIGAYIGKRVVLQIRNITRSNVGIATAINNHLATVISHLGTLKFTSILQYTRVETLEDWCSWIMNWEFQLWLVDEVGTYFDILNVWTKIKSDAFLSKSLWFLYHFSISSSLT